MLRRSLAESYHEFTTVKDELYFVEHYLAVMKARYEDRLDVALKLDQQVSDYVIPTFLLVPLVENAIKHGVAKAPVRDTVEITGRYKDDHLTFMVTNRAPTIADEEDEGDETSRVGLKITHLRLLAIYGDDYRLECGADGKGHWRSSVALLLRNPPDLAYLITPLGSRRGSYTCSECGEPLWPGNIADSHSPGWPCCCFCPAAVVAAAQALQTLRPPAVHHRRRVPAAPTCSPITTTMRATA